MRFREKITQILTWSERYTKTDMHYVASGSFWSMIGQIMGSGTAFLLSLAFANLLTPDAYGIYKYLLTLGEIISYVTLSGLSGAITSAVAMNKDGMLRSGFWINLQWSLGSIAAATLGALYYYQKGNSTFAYSLLVMGLFAPLIKSGSFFSSFLHGKKDFQRKTLYETGRTVLSAIAMTLALLLSHNPLTLITVFYIVNTLTALLFYIITIRHYHPPIEHDKETIRYAKHTSVMSLIGIVTDHIDKLLVFQFLGPSNLAIYTFATAIPDQVRNFLKRIHALALPKFAEKHISDIHNSVMQKIFPSLMILTPITVLYIIFAPIIYRLFFPQYMEAIIYSQVYALSFFAYANLASQALLAKQLIKENYIMNILSAIFRIGFMALFGWYYGIWGIIIGQLAAKALLNIPLFIMLKRLAPPETSV